MSTYLQLVVTAVLTIGGSALHAIAIGERDTAMGAGLVFALVFVIITAITLLGFGPFVVIVLFLAMMYLVYRYRVGRAERRRMLQIRGAAA